MSRTITQARTITQDSAAVVVQNSPAGAYRHLVLQAAGIAAVAEPGQFVACAVGRADGTGALLLRRAFSLHRADRVAGTIDVVVAPHAPGTEWICRRAVGDALDVVGPAGRGFRAPESTATPVVLVGGGYGAAPLGWFADELRARGFGVDVIVGAASRDRLFGHDKAGPASGESGSSVALPGRFAAAEDGSVQVATEDGSVHVATEDGSLGVRGRVTDVLEALLPDRPAGAEVYACGPMGMLRAVHEVAEKHGGRSQLAVEESMACGVGVCMTCVLPATGPDGITRMTRSCIDGPVFPGDALRWDAIDIRPGGTASRVPDECFGAPLRTGGH